MTTPPDKPNSARMVDYVLGGSHHFAVDRQVSEQMLKIFPDSPASARAQRRFLQRAVAWMAEERNIIHFLDGGSGLPSSGNVHEVVHEVHPNAQIVYTDIDPISVAYGQNALRDKQGVTYIDCNITDVDTWLAQPEVQALRAANKPIGISLVGIGMYISIDVLKQMLATLHQWAPPRSALALSLLGSESENHTGIQFLRKQGLVMYTETLSDVQAIFGDWTPIGDGIVAGPGWGGDPTPEKTLTLHLWTVVATR